MLRGLAMLAALALAPAPARADQIQIESPAFTFDTATNRYVYEGALVRLGNLIVQAERVEIDSETTAIIATGRVRFEDGPVTGSAERLEIVTRTGIATLYRAEIYEAESKYFLSADKLVRTGPTTYEGEGCSLTNCRPGTGGWRITAAKIDYESDNFALAHNSLLWLGPAPVLWSPLMGWPTVENRRSGLLTPAIRQSSSTKGRFQLGNSATVPYFWAIGLDQDLTIAPEYFSQRGMGLGLDYNYAFVEDQKGEWQGFGIEETARRDLADENALEGTDLGSEDTHPTRYWHRFQHTQGFGLRTRLVAHSEQASDGQVLREYEGIREYRPQLDYQASLSRQESWANAAATAAHSSEYEEESLFADSTAETNGVIRPQLMPRVTFNTGWQPARALALGFDLEGALTRFVTIEGISGQAAVATPTVSWPVPLAGSLEFRPAVGRRFARYGALDVANEVYTQPEEERYGWLADAETLGSEESFGQNEVELELRMPLARRFDLAEGRWRALKHRVTPRLLYRELEDVPQPLEGLLVMPEPALKLATLRLDNELLGLPRFQETGVGSGIANLNLIQRYDFLRERETYVPDGPALPSPGETDPGEPLLPLILEADYGSASYSLSARLRYHHQFSRVVEYRIGLNGTVSERGRFGVTYSENQITYRTPENRLYGEGSALTFSGSVLGTDTISADFGGRVNLRTAPAPLNRRLQRAEVGVNYQPNCYGVRFSYVETVDVTREFDSTTGENRDEFFIDRRILLTFNLGGVLTTTRGYVVEGP